MEMEQVENEFVAPPLTGEEQLNILRGALKIVDERIDDCRVTNACSLVLGNRN